MHLTKHLLSKFRNADEAPKLHLFGQLKRVTKQWLDHHLVCKGDTFPAQLMYLELANMACERILAGITAENMDKCPVEAILDSYNPTGSTAHVRFSTSKTDRWETSAQHCHVNFVVLDSDWEAELCRVVEAHPKVRAYVKNHSLGFEVPYRMGADTHKYRPDFIVLIDDGRGADDLLRLVVEVKGYRGEDAKVKKQTIETYWVPGVNHLGSYGRWAFAEFTDMFAMASDFKAVISKQLDDIIASVAGKTGTGRG
jgi:type III restriction enzyme